VNHEVTVELKNDISVRGTLKSVDQYLNIKLDDISVVEEMKYPHLVSWIRTVARVGNIRGLCGRHAYGGHAAWEDSLRHRHEDELLIAAFSCNYRAR
jgi:small nuclear ribonucleoprotein (snRNP)-like protein